MSIEPIISQRSNIIAGMRRLGDFLLNFNPLIPQSRRNIAALLLFIAALLPRLIGLDRFLTSDENTNIFFAGSDVIAAFLRGDLRGTYWHFYPGVTMSWLDALGMGGQYLFDLLFGATRLSFTDYIYGDILSLVVANRVPYAILTAAAVPALYLMSRKFLPNRVAILGALFLAFDPFYLAHSRVAHGDAPVAVFMSLSALAFFIFAEQFITNQIKEGRVGGTPLRLRSGQAPKPPGLRRIIKNPYLIASAILGSLAALTKAPGQFMALFIIGMSMLYAILLLRQNAQRATRNTQQQIATSWLTVVVVWGLISLITFIFLWPSMWVDPPGTLVQMWHETFGKVNEGHLVYFMGQPTLDPGPWFYAYVIPFRLAPVTLIGSLLSLLFLIPKIKRLRQLPVTNYRLLSPELLLWIFTISLFLFGILSPKKQDRYLLPLFPFIDLLAATGWLGLLSIINYQLSIIKTKNSKFKIQNLFANTQRALRYQLPITNLLIPLLLLLHLLPTFTYYPYYLTYFNPLMGGPKRAAETTLMGWGEGMEQVAAYLNTKPNAENLYVASTPSQTLLPYFAGTGENFYTNDIALRADYVVLYLAQMQRLAPSPEIVRYFEAQVPERVITIKDITYAKIYPGPKLILSAIPPDATPANIGLDNTLRLAGYQLPNPKPETRNLKLTLYWHALAPMNVDYTISLRVKAAGGQILLQQDRWPVEGLLPTSQWRQGDYVVDSYTLDLTPAEVSQISAFEVVVYNAETGETLGPPITIDNE